MDAEIGENIIIGPWESHTVQSEALRVTVCRKRFLPKPKRTPVKRPTCRACDAEYKPE